MEPTANSNPAQTQQLPNHKVKIKMPLQRACNEKDEKGKLCGGHLKRWFYAFDTVECACGDVERAWGKKRRSVSLRALQDGLSAKRGGAQG